MKLITALLALSVAALITLAWLFVTFVPSRHLPPWTQLLIAVVFVMLTVWNFIRFRRSVSKKKEIKKSALPYIFIISGLVVVGLCFCWLFVFPEVLPGLEFLGSLVGIGVGIFLVARGLIPRH